jgi:RsiW-degrading membrane proteinase PrsW (M82 family)/RNA polymerase subunit RPABC4/transcription elongation factor Spt4
VLELLLIPVLGMAPGIFWLWLIYGMDKYRPEPKGLVIRTFVLGIASVVPVSIVEMLLALPYIIPNSGGMSTADFLPSSLGSIAYFSFIIAGFTEELFKFLVVRTTVYRSPYFDEPLDGLIYASAAALGFASLENVMYLFTLGWEAILVRGPISTVAHVIFSGLWGYPLALRKLKKPKATLLVWLGLLGSMAGHGLFDFIAFSQEIASEEWNIILWAGLFILFGGLVVLFILLFVRGLKNSPFKNIRTVFLVSCPNCQSQIPYYASFCPACGNKQSKNKKQSPVYCGKCRTELNSNTIYCPSCGSRMLKKLVR